MSVFSLSHIAGEKTGMVRIVRGKGTLTEQETELSERERQPTSTLLSLSLSLLLRLLLFPNCMSVVFQLYWNQDLQD